MMKQFSQMGYGAAEKVEIGLNEKTLDGAIFSPKDLSKRQIMKKIKSLRTENSDVEIFIDPQFYAWKSSYCMNKKLGAISSWDYLQNTSSSSILHANEIRPLTELFFDEIQKDFPNLSGIITPNIYITDSFGSSEANNAKQFIKIAQDVANKKNEKRPIFPTIAIGNEGLLKIDEVKAFLNQLKILENPPAGFYLLIGAKNSTTPTEICNSDVISMWMYINHILSEYNYKIINGYSDIISPFLQIAGGHAGATGWWGNLRCFSMERFCEQNVIHSPSRRYLSIELLNRILCVEYRLYTQQNILKKNGLSHDIEYDISKETAPIEALQTWESISFLLKSVSTLDQLKSIIKNAKANYAAIKNTPVKRLSQTSKNYHLEIFSDSIKKYESLVNA